MLKILVKKQLTEIFRSYFYNPKTNKARSKGAVAGYIILFAVVMVGLLGGMFTMMSLGLCGPLVSAGMGWLYFALMSLLAVLLGAFGSVFNTYSGLYLAKDNDLLLSMPIPVNTLMASRLLSVYLMGLMYSGVVILPAVIVYWVVAPVTAGVILGGVLLLALLSVFVLTLSCALGWVVAKISLKLKNKSFITMLVSLVFIGVYYFFVFRAQTFIEELVGIRRQHQGRRVPAVPAGAGGHRRRSGHGHRLRGGVGAVRGDVGAYCPQLPASGYLHGPDGTARLPGEGGGAALCSGGATGQGAGAVHRQSQLYAQLRTGSSADACCRRGAAVEGRRDGGGAGRYGGRRAAAGAAGRCGVHADLYERYDGPLGVAGGQEPVAGPVAAGDAVAGAAG